MTKPIQHNGFILMTDLIGMIREVKRDDLLDASANSTFLKYVDASSMSKVMALFTELKKTESQLGWEINVKRKDSFISIYLAGLKLDDQLVIIGSTNQDEMSKYYDDFMQMNNQQTNSLRKVLKEKSTNDSSDAKSNIQFDELTKINNEMANLQRDLAQKNRKLKALNLAVKNSIDYSEKIQFSILPSNSSLKKYFEDSFILFEPKDTIGGDFYWFYEQEEYIYLATVDCTGHGVPGALMSMAVSSALNEILAVNVNINSHEILKRLHSRIHKTFKQDAGDRYSQDGCDISLCRFDLKKERISFAGAQSDLYIFKDGQFDRLSGDKKSIGGESIFGIAEKEREFNSTEIDIPSDAFIVLTTDGILDQLNTKDSAFGNKAFMDFFLSRKEHKGEEIKIALEQTLKEWSNDVPQFDDMLVIGLIIKNGLLQ